MLLIVAHHYVVNSGLTAVDGPIYAAPLSWRSLFLLILGAWGKTGINCFVVITGYFMCKSQITAKKFAKLFFEVMFYHIVIYVLFVISRYKTFSIIEFLWLLIPVRKISNGFVSAYLVFFLLIPFLNVLLQHMSEKQHLFLILWCGFTYVFLGTVPGFSVTMNYVSWFSVVYIIASYVRYYPKKIYTKGKAWGWLVLTFLTADFLTIIVCTMLSKRLGMRAAYAFLQDCNTFLAIATGICAFMFFKNLRIPCNKTINTVASSTFGVLLIHANSDTMRQWLWRDVLDCVGHYKSAFMPLYVIASVAGVFIVCVFLDQLRIRFIEKPFFRLWDKKWNGIAELYYTFKIKLLNHLDNL